MRTTVDEKIEDIQEQIMKKNKEQQSSYDLKLDSPHTGDAEFIFTPGKKWLLAIVEGSEGRYEIAREAEELLDSEEVFYCYFSDSIKKNLSNVIKYARDEQWTDALKSVLDMFREVSNNLEVY